MSGGPATIAFGYEGEYANSLVDSDSDGTPEYYEPGTNLTITDAELTNVLTDINLPDEAEPVESIAQDLEGAFGLEGTISSDTFSNLLETVFNDGGVRFAQGLASSSRWFLGIDHWAETAERELFGFSPTDFSINYQRGESPTWSMSGFYSHEEYNTSISPTDITRATEGSTVPSHGIELTLDTNVQAELQSCTLTASSISRPERGPGRRPLNAVSAGPTVTFDATVLFRNSNHIETAYGMDAATEPQSSVESISGSLTFSESGSVVSDLSMPTLDPETYSWADLLTDESSLAENMSMRVNGGLEETA